MRMFLLELASNEASVSSSLSSLIYIFIIFACFTTRTGNIPQNFFTSSGHEIKQMNDLFRPRVCIRLVVPLIKGFF